MPQPFFSIIIVCLNPGEKLKLTVDSIVAQNFMDYEVIIQDGLSTDAAAVELAAHNTDARIRLYREKDTGIYDAMNRAVEKARGEYLYFLNCGDLFRDEQVLMRVKDCVAEKADGDIYYGNIHEEKTAQTVKSNPHIYIEGPAEPRIDRFACYRHLPCHQACFYRRSLLAERPFSPEYKVMADYEHFLWAILENGASLTYLPLTIARYEGGGYSETKENRKRLTLEHRRIVAYYMTKGEIFYYRLLLTLTLAPLRATLAKNKHTAGIYQGLKKKLYKNHE